ncbi:MAG TPA: hypothetical protein PKA58_08330 [Polyangium sp.]|jgi:hypothetical protein|nr:hypothetical protein [Polyangium sp.]
MDEFDAYAPPQADTGGMVPKKKRKSKKALSGDIAEAIARLNEHIADANAMERDRREAGGRLRRPTIGFIVFSAIACLAAAVVISNGRSSRWEPAEFGFAVFAGFLAFMTIILVVVDLRFPLREQSISPEETLKYFFRAIAMARFGYAWSALCPTAREQSVEPPDLGPVPVGSGSFTLRTTQELKDYTATFARPGNGQMRTVQIKHVTLLREEDDVATVEVHAVFQAWPQWAQIVSIVGLVIIRIVGIIIFFTLYFILRKTHEVTFRKKLIRGSNGVWYVYSPQILENVRADD